jgi:uncharacterized membrane protein
MKKVLLTLLAVIVIIGALAGAGFAGYRIGYIQGASGNVAFTHMNPNLMPMQRFDRDFGPGFNNYRSPMMGRGNFGINFFSPFRILWNIAILALIIWFVYWLFTKSGWQITRNATSGQDASPQKEGN